MEAVDERLTYKERIAALSIGNAALDLTEPRPLKLTIDDLVMLDRQWQDDDHKSTELIDGRIYFTPARYRPRAWTVQQLWARLRDSAALVAPHLFVGMRGSIEVSRYDLPLLDIILTSEADGEGFIPTASVSLVVEVCDSALNFYMGEKLRLYARARIPEYWVVNLDARTVHQMWAPVGDTYDERQHVAFGQSVTSATASGVKIDTEAL